MANHRWFTPNTYDDNYKQVPPVSGVYCIKELVKESEYSFKYLKPRIVYVGSTINLKNRYSRHEVLSKLIDKNPSNIYQFYFKIMKTGFYDLEISLIKRLKPLLNKAHKNG